MLIMYQYLTATKENGIAIIQFMRPDQLNAMNRAFMNEIADALNDAFLSPEAQVIILTGSGRAFMAGADIKEYAAQTDEEFNAFQNKGKEIYEAIEDSTKPVIAAVNGFALGGGFEICLACDLIVAAKSAKFGLPEVNIGLVPGGGGTQRMIQKVGMNRVKEILFFGGQYTAEKMLEWGAVNYVVEDDQLMPYAKELAAKLQRRSLPAIAELKRLANLSLAPETIEKRRIIEIAALFDLFHTEQAKERILAFSNKNKK